MPVCSRPFHHARSLSSSCLVPPSFFFPTPFFRSSFSARLSPDVCLIFAAAVDLRPLAPACAGTCVHLRINPSSLFSRVTLSRLSFHPLSPRLFRHNRYPRAVAMSCVTFILAYVSISHSLYLSLSLSYFHPTINTLSHSVYILLAIREILNVDKIDGDLYIIF